MFNQHATQSRFLLHLWQQHLFIFIVTWYMEPLPTIKSILATSSSISAPWLPWSTQIILHWNQSPTTLFSSQKVYMDISLYTCFVNDFLGLYLPLFFPIFYQPVLSQMLPHVFKKKQINSISKPTLETIPNIKPIVETKFGNNQISNQLWKQYLSLHYCWAKTKIFVVTVITFAAKPAGTEGVQSCLPERSHHKMYRQIFLFDFDIFF